jgi:hypothetical protein
MSSASKKVTFRPIFNFFQTAQKKRWITRHPAPIRFPFKKKLSSSFDAPCVSPVVFANIACTKPGLCKTLASSALPVVLSLRFIISSQ